MRLFAAAAALREAIGTPAALSDRQRCERDLARARAALYPKVAEAAQAHGRATRIEETIAYALIPETDG
jgi:hypothetical protein